MYRVRKARPGGWSVIDRTRLLAILALGVSTIMWATGYALEYRWIDAPIFDEFGYPKQRRGVTDVPGLSFLGLSWHVARRPSAGPVEHLCGTRARPVVEAA